VDTVLTPFSKMYLSLSQCLNLPLTTEEKGICHLKMVSLSKGDRGILLKFTFVARS
jgi:hypothetical protein